MAQFAQVVQRQRQKLGEVFEFIRGAVDDARMRKAQEEGSQKERLERLLPLHLLVYARCLALSLPIQRPTRRRAADQPPHGLGLRERTWASAWSKTWTWRPLISFPGF